MSHYCMAETIRERWLKLFDQAWHELDLAKLMALIAQIKDKGKKQAADQFRPIQNTVVLPSA